MTARLTGLAVTLTGLAAWALFLGVISGRVELLLTAVPLLVVLLSAEQRRGPAIFSIKHRVSTDRTFEGEEVILVVTLTAKTPVPLLEILEPLSPQALLVDGCNRTMVTLDAGQQKVWRYGVRCVNRGRYSFGALHLRVWDRTGLCCSELRHDERSSVLVYPHVEALRRLPRPRRTQMSFGNYVSPKLGEGLEPGDIRPFAPGDRVRRVNWRASLRLGQLFVTAFHEERNADVVLLLDTLSEIGAHPASTLDYCVRAAAALGTGYLSRKDRVGLIEYGAIVQWIKPAAGRQHHQRLIDALLPANMGFTYLSRDLDVLPARVLPPRALVLVLSPLTEDRLIRAISNLAGRGFDVVVLAVSPIEPTRRVLRPGRLTDLACRLWALERQTQFDDLRRKGVEIIEWRPDEPLPLAIARAGRRRPIRSIGR